eukprot:gene1077-1364_t
MSSYSTFGAKMGDMNWAPKKGANSHATPKKRYVMENIEDTNTSQFLVPPVNVTKIRRDGDIERGGDKRSNLGMGKGR